MNEKQRTEQRAKYLDKLLQQLVWDAMHLHVMDVKRILRVQYGFKLDEIEAALQRNLQAGNLRFGEVTAAPPERAKIIMHR